MARRLKDETDPARVAAMAADNVAKVFDRLGRPPGKLAAKKRMVKPSAEERREAASWKKVYTAAEKAAAKKAAAKPATSANTFHEAKRPPEA